MREIQEQHSIQSYRIGINSYINAIISSYSTENAEKILRKFYIFISTWCDGAELEPVECSRNTKIQDLIEMAERVPDKRLDALLCWASQYQDAEQKELADIVTHTAT